MNDLFSYYEGELGDFIAEALLDPNHFIKRVILGASESLVDELHQCGIDIDATWKHTLDNSAVRHAMNYHGSEKESLRGQIPITEADLLLIPEIIEYHDFLSIDRNKRGQDIIIYAKIMDDGLIYYVEEVRIGRRELAAITMYKRKKENSPTLMG